jgi:SAM-dependent methyltransferase
MQPAYHRKLWEFAYIAQVLSQAGVLRAGTRGLGFGCGKEPLASLFAHAGSDVVATDLGPADSRAKAWSGGEQHADSVQDVWRPDLCSREEVAAHLQYRSVDMNSIPADLHRGFDYCWSSCALEHLGSIENGLRFIQASARCLRPGGIAVHTTEYNPDPGRTHETGATVLFQAHHFADLQRRLASDGVEMRPILAREGDPFMDGYVDVPPYPDPSQVGSTLSVLHLRLLIGAHRSTSIGLAMRFGG